MLGCYSSHLNRISGCILGFYENKDMISLMMLLVGFEMYSVGADVQLGCRIDWVGFQNAMLKNVYLQRPLSCRASFCKWKVDPDLRFYKPKSPDTGNFSLQLPN